MSLHEPRPNDELRWNDDLKVIINIFFFGRCLPSIDAGRRICLISMQEVELYSKQIKRVYKLMQS